MKIHLAILTYNALDYTQRCLQSLLTHTTLPFDVQILDNASSDGTQAWLAGLSDPRIRVCESPVNLGVPRGRNRLLELILPEAADEDFVVFLDNDIELHAGWHEPFERLFAEQPRAGMASKVGWTMQVREDTRDPQTTPWETARVDIVAGGFACWTRVRAIREVGPQDEELGLFWHEDDDWAVRFTGAGWSIWAVPESPMTHHEHASGVAWPTLDSGDSKRNLAYLADKWRRHGLVDDAGWVRDRDPLFCPPIEVRQEMQRRLGRVEPVSRGEYVQCYWDLHALLCTLQQARVFPRPVSPGLTVLLGLLCEGSLFECSPEMLERYRALSQSLEEIGMRRRAGAAERQAGPAPRAPVHGVARSDSWEDPRWLRAWHELLGPGTTASWFERTAVRWVETTMLASLDQAGLLDTASRGLLLDPRDVALASAIAHRGTGLCVCGHFDIASEAGGGLPPEFASDPQRWWDGSTEGLRVCRPHELSTDERFDFVLARAGLCSDGEDPALIECLKAAEPFVAPGGQVYVQFDCIVGDRGQAGLRPPAHVYGLTLRTGFAGDSDAGLPTSCPSPVRRGHAPELCIRRGDAFETMGLVCYEKPRELPLPRPDAHHAARTDVLVDLRGMVLDAAMLADATREGLAQTRALSRSGFGATLLWDGDCPEVLRALLAHPDVRYRNSAEGLDPDVILYLEGARWCAPRLEAGWSTRPVLAFQTTLSRDLLRERQDAEGAADYLRFVQREATHLLVHDPVDEPALRAVFDLGRLQLVPITRTGATLQSSPLSPGEARAFTAIPGPYLLLEGSQGARERFTAILAALQEQVLQEGLSILAMGPEFAGLEALVGQGSHPLLSRLRIVPQVPEVLRRPLLEGAQGLIVASHPWEFRLAAEESSALGLPIRRLDGASGAEDHECTAIRSGQPGSVTLATLLAGLLRSPEGAETGVGSRAADSTPGPARRSNRSRAGS